MYEISIKVDCITLGVKSGVEQLLYSNPKQSLSGKILNKFKVRNLSGHLDFGHLILFRV